MMSRGKDFGSLVKSWLESKDYKYEYNWIGWI